MTRRRKSLVGIREMPWGREAYLKVQGRQVSETFALGTSDETIQRWREDKRRELVDLAPKAERGSFADDVAIFLKKQHGRRSVDFDIHLTKWLAFFKSRNLTHRHSVTQQDVQAGLDYFQVTFGYSASYLNKLRQALISVWKDRDGKRHQCPACEIPKFDEGKPEPRAIAPELVERAFATLADDDGRRGDGANVARLQLTYYTGARPCEVARLVPERVHLEAPQPYIHYTTGKGGDDRVVPLNAKALEVAKRFVALDAFGAFSESATRTLFQRAILRVLILDTHPDYASLTRDQQREIRRETRASMVQETRASGRKRWRFQPYVLRHTCFTELRKRGTDLADVQALAGHKDIATTQRYSPTVTDKLAAAMKRLED